MFRLCSTVAVPALVYETAAAYTVELRNSPHEPKTARRRHVARSASMARRVSRCSTSSVTRNTMPAPSCLNVVSSSGSMVVSAKRNWMHVPENPHAMAPARVETMPSSWRLFVRPSCCSMGLLWL